MASSNFSSLRNSRKNALDKLNEEIKKEGQKQGADERFWKLTVDAKTKVGYARLRFLPAPKNEEVPWVRVFAHAFKFGGAWFIDNCPTTLGQRPCPVCKENNKLWNGGGGDADKNIARDRKRKLQFISNVLVVDDPAHPENNGKVFLFKYGAKIHDKIQESLNPQYPGDLAINPFDLWEGADFKLKSADVAGYQNYDKSEFADAKELFPKDDDAKEAIWVTQHSLQQFVNEDQFKSYDELEKRLDKVLHGDSAPRTAQDAMTAEQPTVADAITVAETVEKKAASARKPRTTTKVDVPVVDDAPDDEDDIKKFFGEVLAQ